MISTTRSFRIKDCKMILCYLTFSRPTRHYPPQIQRFIYPTAMVDLIQLRHFRVRTETGTGNDLDTLIKAHICALFARDKFSFITGASATATVTPFLLHPYPFIPHLLHRFSYIPPPPSTKTITSQIKTSTLHSAQLSALAALGAKKLKHYAQNSQAKEIASNLGSVVS